MFDAVSVTGVEKTTDLKLQPPVAALVSGRLDDAAVPTVSRLVPRTPEPEFVAICNTT